MKIKKTWSTLIQIEKQKLHQKQLLIQNLEARISQYEQQISQFSSLQQSYIQDFSLFPDHGLALNMQQFSRQVDKAMEGLQKEIQRILNQKKQHSNELQSILMTIQKYEKMQEKNQESRQLWISSQEQKQQEEVNRFYSTPSSGEAPLD